MEETLPSAAASFRRELLPRHPAPLRRRSPDEAGPPGPWLQVEPDIANLAIHGRSNAHFGRTSVARRLLPALPQRHDANAKLGLAVGLAAALEAAASRPYTVGPTSDVQHEDLATTTILGGLRPLPTLRHWHLQACPGNACSSKKRRLQGGLGAVASAPTLPSEGSLDRLASPRTAPAAVTQASSAAEVLPATAPAASRRGLVKSAGAGGGKDGEPSGMQVWQVLHGRRSPEQWRRMQKQPVKVGSAYRSRMKELQKM